MAKKIKKMLTQPQQIENFFFFSQLNQSLETTNQ